MRLSEVALSPFGKILCCIKLLLYYLVSPPLNDIKLIKLIIRKTFIRYFANSILSHFDIIKATLTHKTYVHIYIVLGYRIAYMIMLACFDCF